MESNKAYDVNDAEFIRAKEIQRLRSQALLFWPKELRNLRWFGLRDGMHLLEVGSGPGFITEALLEALPTAQVTGIEIDQSLTADAERLLRARGLSRFHYINASVTASNLPDNSFDFAYARLVFQHLPDPNTAAAEVRRLLKPGGRLVITDIDLELMGVIDPMPEAYPMLRDKRERFIASRGSNRRIGRDLWKVLARAGFTDLGLEIITAHSDEAGIESFRDEYDADALAPLVSLGVFSADDLDAARASVAEFLANDPYLLVALMMVSGVKPG